MLFCGPVSALPESPFIFSELKASTCLPLRHLTGDRGKKKQTAFKSSQLQTHRAPVGSGSTFAFMLLRGKK